MEDILNLEIARELLVELNPTISDDEVNRIWSVCNGSPWNAPILYQLLQIANRQQ